MGTELKVGVRRGGGPPPGYRWTVLVLDVAYEESRKFLNEDQYEHVAMQVKELAKEDDPTHSKVASVDAVEDFHELRDKGGILGGMNVRVFFILDKVEACLVVIGAIKKQNNGPTPFGDKVRMTRRRRKYLNGEYDGP
jgi:hypothetical protein